MIAGKTSIYNILFPINVLGIGLEIMLSGSMRE